MSNKTKLPDQTAMPDPVLFELEEVLAAEPVPFNAAVISGNIAVADQVENPRLPYIMGPLKETGTTELPHFVDAPKPQRTSRRGGRSYPEKGGADVARDIQNQDPDKDKPAAPTGRAYDSMRAQMRHAKIIEKAAGDPSLALVLSKNEEVRAERGKQ